MQVISTILLFLYTKDKFIDKTRKAKDRNRMENMKTVQQLEEEDDRRMREDTEDEEGIDLEAVLKGKDN